MKRMPALSCRHLKVRERAVQIIIKRFHCLENFNHFWQECPDIQQILIVYRVFEIPAFIFQVFGMRVFFFIACRHIFESGSLYRMLSHFMFNNLNMVKIESRPIKDKSFEYRFFVDLQGNLGDGAVQNALRGLVEESLSMKVLGNY